MPTLGIPLPKRWAPRSWRRSKCPERQTWDLESQLGSRLIRSTIRGWQPSIQKQVISRQPVVAGSDAPEVLEPVERTFDAPAQFIETLAEAERLLPVATVRNDRLGSASAQLLVQLGAVVGLVAEHSLRRLYSADQPLCNRAIMGFAAGQQDSEKPPFSICECVNLRVAPSARAANSLLLLPPFPPTAERCAFTCVELIICVSVDRPFPASSRNRFSQMPRSAQRTKRL